MNEGQRILVVDDQQEILDITATVLSSAGFSVVTASSGGAALDLVGRGSFDLVLLDINMPEMDGWETLRLLRADELLDELHVVMFSVKGELSDKVQSLKEGASGYITKPFVVDELVARVRRVLASAEVPASRSGS
jgi:two-component system copper resistance phosphate regulon response regulator CusR